MDGLFAGVLAILSICLALAVFFLACRLFGKGTVLVASMAYDWASRFGFFGRAVYIGCWIFMLPLMLGICVAGGILMWLGEQHDRHKA